MKAIVRAIGSPRLALALIVLVGVWSMLATIVPQGHLDSPEVGTWISENRVLGSLTSAVGLHHAFSAPVFGLLAAVLATSTAICSWRRTRAAVRRGRMLRAASGLGVDELAARHDVEIAIVREPSVGDVLATTRTALETIGLRPVVDGDVVRAVSPRWSVWGSPVFHWALVLLVLAAFAGILFRAEGSMAIPIGQTRLNAPESYLHVDTGPLHSWAGAQRSIRVDDFDPGMNKGDLMLGAVPTVSVLDDDGAVIAHGDVYPNNKLHAGSLSISAPTCGLTATISIAGASGSEFPPVVQLVAFSEEASGGTEPLEPLAASNDSGQLLLRMRASIPLDRTDDGTYGQWIPQQPAARILLEDGSGAVIFDGPVRKGERAPIRGGGTIELLDIGWYTHLALVHDPSIPFVYAAMALGMVGLSISLISRQYLFAGSVIDVGDGRRVLVVRLRLWHNSPTDRTEIERVLTEALGVDKEGGVA